MVVSRIDDYHEDQDGDGDLPIPDMMFAADE